MIPGHVSAYALFVVIAAVIVLGLGAFFLLFVVGYKAIHARNKQLIQIKHNGLRILTAGRLTSWLFTQRGGVEFGTSEDKSI